MKRPAVIAIVVATLRRFLDHDGLQNASSIAYAALLAILPFLVAVISLGTLLPIPGFETDIADRLFEVFPAQVAASLRPAVEELLATPRGGLFGFSLLIALWTSSSSIEALRVACNQALEAGTPRRWWRRRLQAMTVVLIGAVGLIGLGILLYAGDLADAWVGGSAPGGGGATDFGLFRPIILLLGAIGFVALLFRVLPRRRPGWRRILLGACVVVALWVAGTACLSYYIDAVSTVNPIYASLGGIIGVMVFFYFFALVLVLGVELVAELELRAANRAKAATPSPPAPP